MRKWFPCLFLITFFAFEASYSQDLQYYYSKAREAYGNRNYDEFYDNIREANKLHPYHQNILYQLGIACALTNHPDQAIVALKKAIHINAGYDLKNPDLKPLFDTVEFTQLLELQEQLKIPVLRSDTAIVVNDGGAHIESVAYDSRSKSFFLGSIHKRKILKREIDGAVTDFTKSGEFGLTAVFGLRIDEKKRVLWACASPMPEMENFDSTASSAVYKFDISSGKLLSKFETREIMKSVFGDLILDSKGNVFVSDGTTNTIFKVNESTNQLDAYFKSDEFWNIQGITFSDDENYLFISDYIKGPFRLEVSSKKLIKLESETEESLKGIDGMLYYNNSLIAIQNGVSPPRVSRYQLNKERNRIINCEILVRAHPAFNEPTIGYLSGNTFYFVANSLWGAYDEKFNLKPELIQDVVILKSDLSK